MPQSGSSTPNFDLNSQSGVMSVLASIRASALGNQEKNELRDLVFHYTKSGGDASVKIALEQKLISHQILPVQVKVSAGPATGPALAFGSYRPTPTFKTPSVSTTPVTPVPTPVAATSVPVQTPVQPAPATEPVPVAATPVTPNQVPVVTVPQAQVAAIPVQPTVSAPVTTPAPVSTGTEAEYLERIRQIKTAVNSKVGNPVNLVDINNEVGREYMNALLEAMKKLSGGAISEMGVAMARLEKAYAAVETAIADHAKSAAPAAPVTPPVQQPNVSVPVATAPVEPVSEAPIVVPVVAPLPRMPEPVIRPDIVVTQPDPVIEASVPATPAAPSIPIIPTPEVEEKSGYEIAASTPTPTLTPTSPSLADREKILTPADLPDAATLSTGAAGDTLFTKEIDDGLGLLLSDWTIFKKSGLFGTGPKGREHPLFKKIAELQIPLILAGRFEGSSQEIRQSITDYMNGWRYEQGIIYQPGETFEHYLRRVIRHIIDLQNKHR